MNVGLAAALAFQLPGELIEPLVRIGPIGVSNVEATGYLLAAAWLAAVLVGAVPRPSLPGWAVIALGVLAVGVLLSSAFAMFDQSASIKAGLRVGGAVVIGGAIASICLSAPHGWRWVAAGGLAGAAISAALGIVEFAFGWDELGWLYGRFREAPISLGGFATRATGTLLHPNMAAWFWGTTGIAALSGATITRGTPRAMLLAAGAILLLATALALSRGGLIGVGAASIVAWVLLARSGRVTWGRGLLTVVIPLPAIAVAASLVSPVVATRLISETDIEWYRFEIEAPSQLESDRGDEEVAISVANLGPVSWPATGDGRIHLSYHLVRPDGRSVDYQGLVTRLPQAIGPGETITVTASVEVTPAVEEAVVQWDLQQSGGTWFSLRLPQELPETRVTVADPNGRPGAGSIDRPPSDAERERLQSQALGRGELWAIAVELIRERPMVGIGIDNYRHGYGSLRGLAVWDETLTSHNIYLEMLVSVGIFAAAWLALAIGSVIRLLPGAFRNPGGAEFVALVALVAVGVHGALDAFLLFSTALYFTAAAVAVGITVDGVEPRRPA